MKPQTFNEKFVNLVNAGFSYLYIPTYEEQRAQSEIIEIVYTSGKIKTERDVYYWTQTDGLVGIPREKEAPLSVVNGTKEPIKALEAVEKAENPGIYIFKDMHVFLGSERGTHADFALVRKLRDILKSIQAGRKNIVFLSPKLVIPCEMEKEISVVDFDLPTEEEIKELLDSLCAGLSPEQDTLGADEKKRLVRAALGLTMQEAENAFCRAIVTLKGMHKGALEIIHDEKNQVVKKTGVLEFINSNLGIDDIGGLENLKNWLIKRNNTWGEQSKLYNLPAPKGLLITGVPGCGKSLTAKAMSAIWGLPLLKLDMGRIFGGLVGSSEENMRKAIATAEAVSPSILWVDEIEKGLSGVTKSGGGGDAGTSVRVFGTFLTWLQDKEKPVFVIATANDISSLPPELLRKGRFDEIFFVDLPTLAERQKIFKVHIQKKIGNSPINHEIVASDEVAGRLAAMAEGFTGSEIEQSVISALFEAFYHQRGLREEDIAKVIRESVPLAKTQAEQIKAIREWASERAVLATAQDDREYLNETAIKEDNLAINPSIITKRPESVQGGRIVNFDL